MLRRTRNTFRFRRPQEPMPSVEVVIDDGNVREIHEGIVRAVGLYFADQPDVTASIYCYQGMSCNFHEPTWSEFFAVCGPREVLQVVHLAVEKMKAIRHRYSDHIAPRDAGRVVYQLEDGRVWQLEDEQYWFSKDPV